MAKSTGPAVDHHHNLILAGNTERRSRLRIEHPIAGDNLHFQVMIPGAQCPQLIDPPPHRMIADVGRIGTYDTTAFFNVRKIPMPAIAFFNAPPSTSCHDPFERTSIQSDEACCPDAGRYTPE